MLDLKYKIALVAAQEHVLTEYILLRNRGNPLGADTDPLCCLWTVPGKYLRAATYAGGKGVCSRQCRAHQRCQTICLPCPPPPPQPWEQDLSRWQEDEAAMDGEEEEEKEEARVAAAGCQAPLLQC